MEKLNSVVKEKFDTIGSLDFGTLTKPENIGLYGAVSTLKGLYQNCNDIRNNNYVKETFGPEGMITKEGFKKIDLISMEADTYAHFFKSTKYAEKLVDFANGNNIHPVMATKMLLSALDLKQESDVVKQMVSAPENKGKSMIDMLLDSNQGPTFYGSFFLNKGTNEADEVKMVNIMTKVQENKAYYEGARKLVKDLLFDNISLKVNLTGDDVVVESKITGLDDLEKKLNKYAKEYTLEAKQNAAQNANKKKGAPTTKQNDKVIHNKSNSGPSLVGM